MDLLRDEMWRPFEDVNNFCVVVCMFAFASTVIVLLFRGHTAYDLVLTAEASAL